jgi:uncharacterized protein (UPF0548 family)
MKTSVIHAAVMACAILLSSLFPSEPALAQGCPTPSFGPTRTFGVGVYPRSVAVGDFNGDGKPDLAVANSGDNPADVSPTRGSLSVLLGNGDGTFQTAVTYSFAGTNLTAIVVGDFNGDGKLDLAVGNEGTTGSGYLDAGVSVLLGNGDGTFQHAVNSSAPGANLWFQYVVGDFNGDGKLDLAMANGGTAQAGYTDNGVSVLLGNGDGTFQTAVNYTVGAAPSSLVVGDFNGDGKPDLAVTKEGTAPDFTDGGVSVLLGNGDGTFQPAVNYAVGSRPISLAVGDFNRDGKPDLAVGDFGLSTDAGVSVLLGNGDGTFQTATNLYDARGAYPFSIEVGDFNGDGKPDLAIVQILPNPVSVLLGNGDGTFQTAVDFSVGPNPNPVSVAVGDFNGDGKPDLAVANQLETAEYVSVLLNTCVSIGPALSIVSSNSTLTLFWPFPSAGFVLESATSLRPPDWQPAPESAVTNSGLLEVMVPVNAGSRYFRLHKP